MASNPYSALPSKGEHLNAWTATAVNFVLKNLGRIIVFLSKNKAEELLVDIECQQ